MKEKKRGRYGKEGDELGRKGDRKEEEEGKIMNGKRRIKEKGR